MGCYDIVTVRNVTLPDNPPQWVYDGSFQTKDFDNMFEFYTIDGNEFLHKHERLNFTGKITITIGNFIMSCGNVIFVKPKTGSSYDYREYAVSIVKGLITDIKLTCFETQEAIPYQSSVF